MLALGVEWTRKMGLAYWYKNMFLFSDYNHNLTGAIAFYSQLIV